MRVIKLAPSAHKRWIRLFAIAIRPLHYPLAAHALLPCLPPWIGRRRAHLQAVSNKGRVILDKPTTTNSFLPAASGHERTDTSSWRCLLIDPCCPNVSFIPLGHRTCFHAVNQPHPLRRTRPHQTRTSIQDEQGRESLSPEPILPRARGFSIIRTLSQPKCRLPGDSRWCPRNRPSTAFQGHGFLPPLSLSTTLSSSHCYHRLCHLSPLAALRSGADAVRNFDHA